MSTNTRRPQAPVNPNQLARERATRLLNQVTTGAVIAGVAGVFGFGALAAVTNSGKSTSTAGTTATVATSGGTTVATGFGLRGTRVRSGASGTGQAATGGS